ncbi:MAG: hypothetical protein ACHQIG_12300 [Acidimicrobiia bacterium]
MHGRSAFAALLCSTTVALATLGNVASAPLADGQVSEPVTITTIVIATRVVGPATGGTTVRLTCEIFTTEPDHQPAGTIGFNFGFDASGQPTTTAFSLDNPGFELTKDDGAWRIVVTPARDDDLPAEACTYDEIDTAGATRVNWSCEYSKTPTPDPPAEEVGLGCSGATGEGTGPAKVTNGFIRAGVAAQRSVVRFTNTYVPKPPSAPDRGPASPADTPVEKVPAFTG